MTIKNYGRQISGIYALVFSDCFYIGRSVHINRRFDEHMRDMRNGEHCSNRNALSKSGKCVQDSYDREGCPGLRILAECDEGDIRTCILLEQKYLDKHWGSPECLNYSPKAACDSDCARFGINDENWAPIVKPIETSEDWT